MLDTLATLPEFIDLAIIANTSVLVAAGLVFITHSVLPDLAVGLLLAFVFAKSAGKVLSESWREMH